jgi:hypothetical protein
MKTLTGVIVVAALTLVLGLLLANAGRNPNRSATLRTRALALEKEAGALQDSSARLRSGGSALDQAGSIAASERIEARAAELFNAAAVLRQARPLAADKMAAEFLVQAQALQDSARRIRSELVLRQGSLRPVQDRRIARLEQQSRSLRIRARLLGRHSSDSQDGLELYSSCVLLYGAGSQTCDQLRGEIPASPLGPEPAGSRE